MSELRFSLAKYFFSMTCRVDVNIRAGRERIWAVLTDARHYGRWNSTVARIEGEIAEGRRLKLHVPGTARVFTPLVSGVVHNSQMTWSDGVTSIFRGVRTFELKSCADGSTNFAMAERFSGLMLPLIGKMLPDFGPIFESFAANLKQEAEKDGLSD